MPVVATMMLMTLLGEENEGLPFTSPGVLRQKLLQANLADEVRQSHALELADRLDDALLKYDRALDRSVDIYTAHLDAQVSDNADSLQLFEEEDRQRLESLTLIVELRQALLALLTEPEWRAVFD